MKKIIFLCTIAVLALSYGCSSAQMAKTSATDFIAPAMAGTGGLIGLYATKDQSIGTQMAAGGAGAAIGGLAGSWINSNLTEEKLKEFEAGYDLGRSNSVKELYWAYQKLHEAQRDKETVQYQYYQLPTPIIGKNGEKLEQRYITIPVAE